MTLSGQSYSYANAWREADRRLGNLQSAIDTAKRCLETGDAAGVLECLDDAEQRIRELGAHLEERV